MGDADTTKPPSSTADTPEDPEDPECSKKQKLNGGGSAEDQQLCPNNNGKKQAEEEEEVKVTTPPITPDEGTKKNDGEGGGGGSEKMEGDDGGEKKVEEVVEEDSPKYSITVLYNKQPLQLSISPKMTVLKLKQMIQAETNVSPELQKVLLKGIAKNEAVLGDLGVGPATKKIMVIGTTIQEVMKMSEIPKDIGGSSGGSNEDGSGSSGNNWCSLQVHKKVIDKGLPDDVMPGILNDHDQLPPFPLHGMLSSKGSKVRLTFKLESDELWIGTKERTDKIPIGSIRNVTSQPITGYEHYHIVAIQLGTTEASRFFVYWVPCQFVEAIKDALTGA